MKRHSIFNHYGELYVDKSFNHNNHVLLTIGSNILARLP